MQLVFIVACIAFIIWLIKKDYKEDAEKTAAMVPPRDHVTVMTGVMKEILAEFKAENRGNANTK